MRIIVNALSTYKGGAEQVVISFINECKKFPENDYHLLLRENILSQLQSESFSNNFTFYEFKKRPAEGLLNYLRTMRKLKQLEKQISPDCVISTGGHGYWRPGVPLLTGYNIPHFVYEDSPYFNNRSAKEKIKHQIKKKINLFFYGRTDAMFVQTDDVKERLQEYFPDKSIYVVPNTVNAYFLETSNMVNKLPEKKKDEIRLLTVSSYYPHKNLSIIKEVISELLKVDKREFRFVLTLPDAVFDDLFSEKEKSFIYNVGPTPIAECPALYNECDYMFLPTLLECFSASYAEAMAMNKPILTSDLGFAHTVCGDAAIYFDPLSADDIVNKILLLSNNSDIKVKLIKNGRKRMNQFGTAEDRAKEYLRICKLFTNND